MGRLSGRQTRWPNMHRDMSVRDPRSLPIDTSSSEMPGATILKVECEAISLLSILSPVTWRGDFSLSQRPGREILLERWSRQRGRGTRLETQNSGAAGQYGVRWSMTPTSSSCTLEPETPRLITLREIGPDDKQAIDFMPPRSSRSMPAAAKWLGTTKPPQGTSWTSTQQQILCLPLCGSAVLSGRS